MRHLALWLALYTLCAPLSVADNAAGSIQQKQLLGQLRPAFTMPDRNGTAQSIARWNGKIIVLNFWATWCAPCRTEIPLLNSLQKEYGARGVQVIGVAVDHQDAVKQFAQSVRMDYPVLISGAEGIEVIARYGNASGALPYTALIRRDGNIEGLASGALTADYLRRTLERMLRATPGQN